MSEVNKYVSKVSITDVVKKKKPSKHYVYMINVLWSDGKQQVICRRYCKFFDLQVSLIDAFPVESGEVNPTQRILPFLPGKIFFGRSNVKNVAVKRKDLLTEYLQKLIGLPEKISQCSLVIDFFEVTPEDIETLTSKDSIKPKKEKTANKISEPVLLERYVVVENFKKTEKNQVALSVGDIVDVIEKHENGWWFVSIEDEQGWAPSSYLDPLEGNKDTMEESIYGMEEKFICTKAFKAMQSDELSLAIGDVVLVLGKCSDGWWKVRLKRDAERDYEGFVPATHLDKVPKEVEAGYIRQSRTLQSQGFVPPPRKASVKKKVTLPSTNLTHVEMNNKRNFLAEESQIEEEESLYVATTDIKVLSDKKLDIMEGAPIVVIEKSPNGWWYVEVDGEKGWIRSEKTHRKRIKKSLIDQIKKQNLTSLEEEKETYITLADFNASENTCISFVKNQLVEVIKKDDVGWWFIKIGNQEGWAPSTYLGKVSSKENNVNLNKTTSSVSENENMRVSELERKKYYTQPIKGNVKHETSIPEIVPKPSPRPKSSLETISKTPVNINSQFPNVRKTSDNKPVFGNKPIVVDKCIKSDKSLTKSVEIEQKSSCIVNSSQTNLKVSAAPPRPPPPKFKESSLQATSKPIPAIPVKEIYIAIGNFEDSDEGMLSLKKGQLVNVLEKDDGGWWYAKVDNRSGWVPSNFLMLSS